MAAVGVDHYENFPVASVLCPPQLRPAIVAIYRFARTADDIADEGPLKADERLQQLAQYRHDLAALFEGRPRSGRWETVFVPLAAARERHALPWQPLDDLLDAFMQDTGNPLYANRAQLLDYCRRSANPVGRLLLHLSGVDDAVSLQQSDDICSALQLINFWQDISVDLPNGRCYVPMDDAQRHGLHPATLTQPDLAPQVDRLVAELCAWARQLMLRGAPLARRIPGRAGWELRLVVAGGLRILDKIQAMRYGSARRRPTLGKADAAALLWLALSPLRLPDTPSDQKAAP
ncbi:MAG: squalene synthase HpnC [Rubrivivax sp.]|jgi:squalene synthase HpnC|nr:squalene synthase HpnC [Rubrivivax sp.]